ncbi:MAG TPA: O-antigen ligase family protein, partial [Opitutaceae bacterium]
AFAVRSLIVSDRSLGRRLAGAASAVVVAATAAAILYVSYPLMRIRVDQLVKDAGEVTRPILWRGALGIFQAHPALGGGGGSFDALFEAFRPVGFRDRPIYAHCDYLNTLADYGAVGFLLFFGAAGVLAWRCASARGLAGAAYTGLIAFALHLLVDFHLKIPALAITVATVAALVAAEAWRVRPEAGSGPRKPSAAARVAALGCGFAALALTFAWAVPMHRAEAERRGARERIDRMARDGTDVAQQGHALGEIDSALAASLVGDPSNAQTWSDKAYADSLLALADPRRTAELGAQVEAEATRAVDLAPVVAEFWIRKGTGLDMEGRWVEGGECFAKALLLAPNRADTWYYQAYHLSLNSIEIGPAAAAASVALRLDPGFLLAQVLRQRLVIRQSPPP